MKGMMNVFGFGGGQNKGPNIKRPTMDKMYVAEGVTNENHVFKTIATGINEEFALCNIGNAGFVIEYAGALDDKELVLIPMSQIKSISIKVKR